MPSDASPSLASSSSTAAVVVGVVVTGDRVLLSSAAEPVRAAIVVDVASGTVARIHTDDAAIDAAVQQATQVIEGGSNLILPGVVDCHVHINEPGRTDWEGFDTATRAAAAGGVTTVVDMPLNSIPPTTTVDNLNIKTTAAQPQCWVDVGFWGGVVPGNAPSLQPLLQAGVRGFKCFLINSGVEEFPHVTRMDLDSAMAALQGTGGVLLFHAEVEPCNSVLNGQNSSGTHQHDVTKYDTFLNSRPKAMENEAIELVISLCRQYRVRCHIVHLSSAEALPAIASAKAENLPLTVETCHHYLFHKAESIPDKATHFKCCPPIRDSANRERLWDAVRDGTIDIVVSDHSPCTPNLKLLENGDFMQAWGGISSLQFGLSIMWTEAFNHGLTLRQIVGLMCERTAQLASLAHRKGRIQEGYDADFVIWDDTAELKITTDMIQHKNKVTPYADLTLRGVACKTIVRGQVVYEHAAGTTPFANTKPVGKLLLEPLSRLSEKRIADESSEGDAKRVC
ncbi:allantoinase [Capsaspora owczarzaki ATCC 30864]|uniref:allantoinase n=1 Tax=Capsaspora owczarzaki (strain ATCC 30864) TaxID=595528 RepID=A0A0D2VIG1_CAPO3|nr:allantoinase [Capsaspora owczarzaki ATCC 30864]KJE89767.1 allantoinase [Capsaspora owczarzaki ATCC 30864]|eukprot:XP_004349693.2 allantoinase [Capsaspora owczarzaki ATCC 30864]